MRGLQFPTILLALTLTLGGCENVPESVINTAPQNPVCVILCWSSARVSDVKDNGSLEGATSTTTTSVGSP